MIIEIVRKESIGVWFKVEMVWMERKGWLEEVCGVRIYGIWWMMVLLVVVGNIVGGLGEKIRSVGFLEFKEVMEFLGEII